MTSTSYLVNSFPVGYQGKGKSAEKHSIENARPSKRADHEKDQRIKELEAKLLTLSVQQSPITAKKTGLTKSRFAGSPSVPSVSASPEGRPKRQGRNRSHEKLVKSVKDKALQGLQQSKEREGKQKKIPLEPAAVRANKDDNVVAKRAVAGPYKHLFTEDE
jgi:hypothetical protein